MNMRCDNQPVRVLLADDDPDDIGLLAECIAAVDPSALVTVVTNGAQLLDFMTGQGVYEQVSRELPDLMIVDINMPVMDGLTAIRRLQKLRSFSHIPVFVLTTSYDGALRGDCLQAGVKDVFVKPTDMARLQTIAAEIMAQQNVQRA